MCPSNLEILAYESSPLGLLCLRRRKLLGRPGTIATEVTLKHGLLELCERERLVVTQGIAGRAASSVGRWRAGRVVLQ